MNTIKLEALSPLSTITDQKLYEAILERVKELLIDTDSIENRNAKVNVELNVYLTLSQTKRKKIILPANHHLPKF